MLCPSLPENILVWCDLNADIDYTNVILGVFKCVALYCKEYYCYYYMSNYLAVQISRLSLILAEINASRDAFFVGRLIKKLNTSCLF